MNSYESTINAYKYAVTICFLITYLIFASLIVFCSNVKKEGILKIEGEHEINFNSLVVNINLRPLKSILSKKILTWGRFITKDKMNI